jgi:FdhD protein
VRPERDTVREDGAAHRQVTRIERGVESVAEDWLAEEVPVQVSVNGVAFAVMMTTPHDMVDFAHGFALSEQLVPPGAIERVDVREVLEGIELDIVSAQAMIAREERLLPGRSGCGVCGSRALEDVVRQPAPVASNLTITDATLETALSALRESQPVNALTGSVHAAAWADAEGNIVAVREDVGRHNALDKLIGAMLRARVDFDRGFVVITSRASYEMVTKAAMAGIGLIVAISAPTALAVELARSCGVTLVGFARPGRHVVYTHPWRLLRDQSRPG